MTRIQREQRKYGILADSLFLIMSGKAKQKQLIEAYENFSEEHPGVTDSGMSEVISYVIDILEGIDPTDQTDMECDLSSFYGAYRYYGGLAKNLRNYDRSLLLKANKTRRD